VRLALHLAEEMGAELERGQILFGPLPRGEVETDLIQRLLTGVLEDEDCEAGGPPLPAQRETTKTI
jgi:hypothetical protein